jgi:hypothetical protein
VSRGLEITPVTAADPVRHFAPNRRFVYSNDWRFSVVNRGRINNLGFVNNQDYDSTATSPLLAVIGDSYVEGLIVPYDSTLHGRLAAQVGPAGRVYSFGASGGALSQYLAMAAAEARRFHPRGLVLVVVGNDFDESLSKYAATPGLHVLADSAGGFALRRIDYSPATLRGWVRASALGRYLSWNLRARERLIALLAHARSRSAAADANVGNTAALADPDRVRDSQRAVDYVLNQLPKATGMPQKHILLVLDGIRPELYSDSTRARVEESYFGQMRRYLLAAGQSRGYEVIDLEPNLVARHRRDGVRFESETDGHWNAIGHGEAAASVRGSRLFQQVFGLP